jgi:uncharacterized radical SAM protein YgiQ
MISRTGSNFDIILVTAEYWDDHPLSPAGVIARVLEGAGFKVGILEKPVTKEHYLSLGRPRLFFGVTSGSIDSMLNNYSPLKKPREDDEHSNAGRMPDRAVTVYCNRLREYHKGCRLVIGGIEASLRRFAHYDYWDNAVRRSILFDTRADILVYGNGEKQVREIADRLSAGRDLKGIAGTCLISRELPDGFTRLPAWAQVKAEKSAFGRMQAAFSNEKDLAQEYDNNYLLQYRFPEYTPTDLDGIYLLPFTRNLHPESMLKMAHFSVVTHRGCLGRCNFCALALHQGSRIVSRTEGSILREIGRLTQNPEFKGYVDDLGGPSANMYGMDCAEPVCPDADAAPAAGSPCLDCGLLNRSHARIRGLLKRARAVPGVKKVFIRSGIRYDLALESPEYLKDISEHHVSGCLKIAPEHFSEKVLFLMHKNNDRFLEFLELFTRLNQDKKQDLRYYLMLGHPGDDLEQVEILKRFIRQHGLQNVTQFQLFTPTPMTVSTCMYWTGTNPITGEEVSVIRDFIGKKELKRSFLQVVDPPPRRH